jgi:hypothetical protein
MSVSLNTSKSMIEFIKNYSSLDFSGMTQESESLFNKILDVYSSKLSDFFSFCEMKDCVKGLQCKASCLNDLYRTKVDISTADKRFQISTFLRSSGAGLLSYSDSGQRYFSYCNTKNLSVFDDLTIFLRDDHFFQFLNSKVSFLHCDSDTDNCQDWDKEKTLKFFESELTKYIGTPVNKDVTAKYAEASTSCEISDQTLGSTEQDSDYDAAKIVEQSKAKLEESLRDTKRKAAEAIENITRRAAEAQENTERRAAEAKERLESINSFYQRNFDLKSEIEFYDTQTNPLPAQKARNLRDTGKIATAKERLENTKRLNQLNDEKARLRDEAEEKENLENFKRLDQLNAEKEKRLRDQEKPESSQTQSSSNAWFAALALATAASGIAYSRHKAKQKEPQKTPELTSTLPKKQLRS